MLMISSGQLSDNCRKLWGKSAPFHPLWKHMLDVAAVALVLPFPMADKNWTQSLISFLAGLHDIGKLISLSRARRRTCSKSLPQKRAGAQETRRAGTKGFPLNI